MRLCQLHPWLEKPGPAKAANTFCLWINIGLDRELTTAHRTKPQPWMRLFRGIHEVRFDLYFVPVLFADCSSNKTGTLLPANLIILNFFNQNADNTVTTLMRNTSSAKAVGYNQFGKRQIHWKGWDYQLCSGEPE